MFAQMKRYALMAAVSTLSMTFSAHAATDKAGETQKCISLQQMGETPVIDDQTILIKMKHKGSYKRMDLVAPCAGLKSNESFSYKTHNDELCVYNQVRVIDRIGPGSSCFIDKIVTVDETEAKALLARR